MLALGGVGVAWFVLVAAMTEARLRRQPALPDRGHRGRLRARRRGRGARAPGRRLARRAAWFGSRAGAARRRRRRVRRSARCRLAARSWRRRTTPASVQGGLRTRRSCGTTCRALIEEAGGRERAARLRQRLQRAVPDAAGGLRAGLHGIDVGWAAHRRRAWLPHPHPARRPAGGQADGRPLPAGRPRNKWRVLTAPRGDDAGGLPGAGPDAPTASRRAPLRHRRPRGAHVASRRLT